MNISGAGVKFTACGICLMPSNLCHLTWDELGLIFFYLDGALMFLLLLFELPLTFVTMWPPLSQYSMVTLTNHAGLSRCILTLYSLTACYLPHTLLWKRNRVVLKCSVQKW